MTERLYRLIIGGTLLLLLYLKLNTAVYVYLSWLLFEAATNLRIPRLITMAKFGKGALEKPSGDCKFNFEAERMFRVVVAVVLFVSIYFVPEQAWFIPWLIGFMLTLAGITNLCPTVIGLRMLGFRD